MLFRVLLIKKKKKKENVQISWLGKREKERVCEETLSFLFVAFHCTFCYDFGAVWWKERRSHAREIQPLVFWWNLLFVILVWIRHEDRSWHRSYDPIREKRFRKRLPSSFPCSMGFVIIGRLSIDYKKNRRNRREKNYYQYRKMRLLFSFSFFSSSKRCFLCTRFIRHLTFVI